MTDDETDGDLIAVVGMAGRFPGAATVEQFWANLRDGVESLTVLDDQRDPDRPEFVPAFGFLSAVDEFDADFFGYAPNQALILDPQQRLLLECANEVLERAGHGGPRRPVTGVFVGGSSTGYAEAVRARLDELPFVDEFQLRHATGVDFLATKVAYHLGLTGPALSVQTACSSSLVAVHIAIQSLLAGDCDLAIAGGASVRAHPPRLRPTAGGLASTDGHCRAFDAAADGAVGGTAVGLVALRPLDQALADGDHVHAVILGTAVGNDGRDKVGFTVPGVAGQAETIRAAQKIAGIDAADVGYVEAHGTGTALGDPIEIRALTRAFRETTTRRGYCRIGSVKTNVGHTDAAAGVVGLIKAVLSVEHGVIPPSLHFQRPNPAIDLHSSPFVVNDRLHTWRNGGKPRIAAVNSLGIGGTNAHVVLEQARTPPSAERSRSPRLLVLSGRTPEAADEAVGLLARHFTEHPATDLDDASWTLRTGRAEYRHRRFAVAADPGEAVSALRAAVGRQAGSGAGPAPALLFAGHGVQYQGMAAPLYAEEPVFREHLDQVAELAAAHVGHDLRDVLLPPAGRSGEQPGLAAVQLSVFAVQNAMARLLLSWGIQPSVVVGHSLGAYAAACLAGVFTVPDAVRLVAERGRLLGTVEAGSMAAVRLPEEELAHLLPDDLCVSVVNGPAQCTVGGPTPAVTRFAADLDRRGVETRMLRIAVAGHSPLVEPVLERFADAVSSVERAAPALPIISDTTGTWADPDEVRSPEYWVRHLRRPVRFGDALATLLADPRRVPIDVGPGRVLATLARQHPDCSEERTVVHAAPHPAEAGTEQETVLTAAGELWAAGVPVELDALHGGRQSRHVALPTYPFQRRRFLVPPAPRTNRTGPPQSPASWIGAATARPKTLHPAGAADEASPTPLVKAVLGAFETALGLPDIEPAENFFDLGGDSLIAMKIAAWATTEFGVPLSAQDVISSPQAGSLAELIEHRRAETEGDRA